MENYTSETVSPESENIAAETEAAAPIYTPMSEPNDPVVGTGAFFGLELLLALPLIGFICCIIFSFAPKNRNLKHYARGKLIWAIIGLVLTAVAIIGAFLLVQALPGIVSEELGVEVENLQEVIDIVDDIPGIVEELGGIEEIAGLVGSVGDLAGIVGQIGESGAIADIVGQIGELDNIEEIVSQLGEIEDVDALIGELENLENIDEIITEIESIENIEELAEQINNPEVVEQLLDAYKNHKG